MSVVFMFSGQGSQYFQMGRELFEKNDTFRRWMVWLDEMAHRSSGQSVIDTLYSGDHRKSEPFDRTLSTHPAIFMVEYSLAQTLMERGVRPDMVLGASLGSFAAAAVAGFIDIEDALSAVIRQATALEEWCKPGGMIAILADPALFAEEFLRCRSELAAVNFSSHFVVTAKGSEIATIETELKGRTISYQRLPVSFAFHSQWIDEAKATFVSSMRSVGRKQNRLPLVCCDRTTMVAELSDDYLWNVVRRPIRFRETIARLERDGARRYVDVGPAGTLATFLKYGLAVTSTSTVQAILTPYGFDQKNLAAVPASIEH
ncbi:MAG TPA: acyltransferase domain-containing protein [Thermoanaerobaculia bacterium]|jgi:bacillaene synthase trans-acting acyltransferase|nr:acyltransferase domain-containing protein [Thermoanaerobaculia bacterium]